LRRLEIPVSYPTGRGEDIHFRNPVSWVES
jgi:hypothetical protein